MKSKGTVFLVDDDEALRRATTRLLAASGFEVKASASAEEYLAGFDPGRGGCLLLDLRMPGMSGLELQRALAARGVEIPIVFLTGHADVPTSVNAMKAGAIDFLEKPVGEDALIAALDRALERDAARRSVNNELEELRRRHASLTPRECDVLRGILGGLRNKQAAFQLGIAERTVKLHRARVLQKMKAGSVAELVRMTERLGIAPQ